MQNPLAGRPPRHLLLTKAEFRDHLQEMGYGSFQASLTFGALVRAYHGYGRGKVRSSEAVIYQEVTRGRETPELLLAVANLALRAEHGPLSELPSVSIQGEAALQALIARLAIPPHDESTTF